MTGVRLPARDRGSQDLLSDPGHKDLQRDGFRRDLLSDLGVRDLTGDQGVQDSLKLGATRAGPAHDELVALPQAARSGAVALERPRLRVLPWPPAP